MIKSSNGFALRRLKYSDEEFLYESMSDFPVGDMTLMQVRNSMSNMLHLGKAFNPDKVTSETHLCTILEREGTPVGFRWNKFERNVAEAVLGGIHPKYRGQGCQTATSFLHGYWYFDVLKLDSCFLEVVNTDNVNNAATKWRSITKAKEPKRKSRLDEKIVLSKITITPEHLEQRRSEHPIYKNVEYTYDLL